MSTEQQQKQRQKLANSIASGQIKVTAKKQEGAHDKPLTLEELNKGTMSNRKFTNLTLFCLLVAILMGTYQFTMGFFPMNAPTKDVALPNDMPEAPAAKYDKLVFVLIDALRADFVSSPSSNVTKQTNKPSHNCILLYILKKQKQTNKQIIYKLFFNLLLWGTLSSQPPEQRS